jgi:hypothetical protein
MWSLLRTILAVLNILGAIVVIALAASAYGKRQAWSYAVTLHDVAINGLPLDKDETNALNQKVVDLLGEQGTKDAFSGQQGPVATQLEEVQRYKSKLDGALDASPDARVRLVNQARFLTPLAASEAERERLASVVNNLIDQDTAAKLKTDILRAAAAAKDEKRRPAKPFEAAFAEEVQALRGPSRKPFEEAYLIALKENPAAKPDEVFDKSLAQMQAALKARYEDAFAPALTGKLPGGGDELTRDQRKAVVASLLFNLTEPMSEIDSPVAFKPGQTWEVTQGPYRRFLTVVGLEAGVKAIRQSATALGRMTDDLRLETDRDRTAFIAAHQDLVNQLQQSALKVAELGDALARQKVVLAAHKSLVARRQEDIKLFSAELAKLNQETDSLLNEVRGMNEQLYKVRVATRNARESNQKFEEKIRSLEAAH